MKKTDRDNIDEIDKIIYEYFDNSKTVPKSTHDAINKAIDKAISKKKNSSIINFRIVAAFCTVFLLTTGVVFAKDIGNFFNKIFNLNSINLNNASVVNAIENEDYVQNVTMDYIEITDNYKIKVDYLMLDDINLYMVFNLYSKDNIKPNFRISLSDLKIIDNSGNTLYDGSTPNSTKENNLRAIPGWKNISTSANEIQELFFLISNGLPDMESLNIQFNRVKLYNSKNPINDYIDINASCNFTIDLIDKLKNRDIIKYEIQRQANSEYEISKCIATDTGLYLLYKTTNSNINFKFLNIDTTYDKTHLDIDDDNNYYFVAQYHITKDELREFENINFLDTNNKKLIFNRIN